MKSGNWELTADFASDRVGRAPESETYLMTGQNGGVLDLRRLLDRWPPTEGTFDAAEISDGLIRGGGVSVTPDRDLHMPFSYTGVYRAGSFSIEEHIRVAGVDLTYRYWGHCRGFCW